MYTILHIRCQTSVVYLQMLPFPSKSMTDEVQPPRPRRKCPSARTSTFILNIKQPAPDDQRQTKSTHSPLTRSNRRHGQYVESCCAQNLDGILIFRRVKELVSAQPVEEEPQERVRTHSLPRAHARRHRSHPLQTRICVRIDCWSGMNEGWHH